MDLQRKGLQILSQLTNFLSGDKTKKKKKNNGSLYRFAAKNKTFPLSQAEWMQYFETEKPKANGIQQLINITDKEIDEMVCNRQAEEKQSALIPADE